MKRKTVTASFRIDEDSFLEIQEEASRQMVSVNTLVNQVLITPTGDYDHLLDYSRAVTGNLFFVPSQDFLDKLPREV